MPRTPPFPPRRPGSPPQQQPQQQPQQPQQQPQQPPPHSDEGLPVYDADEEMVVTALRNHGRWQLPEGDLAKSFETLADELLKLPSGEERTATLKKLFWVHRSAVRVVEGETSPT